MNEQLHNSKTSYLFFKRLANFSGGGIEIGRHKSFVLYFPVEN